MDDIWINSDEKLIIADYKSTSKAERIEKLGDSPWEQQYTRQLGVYRWLLEQNGFTVDETGYLVYANASKDEPGFGNQLIFETTLVPVKTEIDWIEPTLKKSKFVWNKKTFPVSVKNVSFVSIEKRPARNYKRFTLRIRNNAKMHVNMLKRTRLICDA